MSYHERLIDLVGDTPLLRLRRLAAGVRPLILAKLEYLNPGGSVKDRVALAMVTAAEAEGRLWPGGTIVEPTSGNTGVALVIVAHDRGYRCVFTCPDKVSHDKVKVLRALGADVVICPANVPPTHPESYRSVATRLAGEIPGGCQLNQYANEHNPGSHYHGTGPEIWRQTAGRVTCFVAGVGTGGTISGAGRYLREVSGGRCRVIGADPEGSVYSGAPSPRPYLIEGVGQPALPPTYDPGVADQVLAVPDHESLAVTRRLAREEALLTGPSGGMAVAAALRVSAELTSDDVVVVILPDSGRGYLSKVFDDGWMARHGFSAPEGARACRSVVSHAGSPATLTVSDTLATAASVLASSGLPAVPVVAAEVPPPIRAGEIVGSVCEGDLLAALAADSSSITAPVSHVIAEPLTTIGAKQPVTDAIAALAVARGGALAVLDQGVLCGVVGRPQLLTSLGSSRQLSH